MGFTDVLGGIAKSGALGAGMDAWKKHAERPQPMDEKLPSERKSAGMPGSSSAPGWVGAATTLGGAAVKGIQSWRKRRTASRKVSGKR